MGHEKEHGAWTYWRNAGKWYWRKHPEGRGRKGTETLRMSLGMQKETWEGYDQLDEVGKAYVERRVSGMSPTQAMKEVLLKAGKGEASGWVVNGNAAEYERRLRPLIEGFLAGKGMTDAVYDAWEDRMVRGMAEESTAGARLTAIKWLREKREERKYADEAGLEKVIRDCERRMKELEGIMGEGHA